MWCLVIHHSVCVMATPQRRHVCQTRLAPAVTSRSEALTCAILLIWRAVECQSDVGGAMFDGSDFTNASLYAARIQQVWMSRTIDNTHTHLTRPAS
jgi:hypothetical protein